MIYCINLHNIMSKLFSGSCYKSPSEVPLFVQRYVGAAMGSSDLASMIFAPAAVGDFGAQESRVWTDCRSAAWPWRIQLAVIKCGGDVLL